MKIEWTKEDTTEAIAQGWEIFVCDNPERNFELQAVEDRGIFQNDAEAWLHVKRDAFNKLPLAVKALEFLKQESPIEYRNIMAL